MGWDPTKPADAEQAKLFPAVHRDNQLTLEQYLETEHADIPAAGAGTGKGRHKFGRGTTVARDAITDWVVGSFWINTDTDPPILQTAKSVGPVVWEDLAKVEIDQNQQIRNLVLNGDQELWNAGASSPATGWSLVGAGATVSRDTANFKIGLASALVTRVTNDCQYEQDLIVQAGGQGYIRGRKYVVAAWVRATVASRVRLRVNDGVGSSFSTYHDGDGVFKIRTVTRTLDSAATALKVGLQIDTGDTSGNVDGVIVVEGSVAPAFARHTQDGVFRNRAVYIANGTFIVPDYVTEIIVTAVAGGGGGGQGGTRGSGFNSSGGGAGGGAAGGAVVVRLAVTPGSSHSITIGASGAGGSGAAPPANGNPGAAGGDTLFGSLVTVKGGLGGGGGLKPVPATGGAGGLSQGSATPGAGQGAGVVGSRGKPVGGDGGNGGFGHDSLDSNAGGGGVGGDSLVGKGGAGGAGGNAGVAGGAGEANTGAGGGGGGGSGVFNNAGGIGGAGAAGLVIVEW